MKKRIGILLLLLSFLATGIIYFSWETVSLGLDLFGNEELSEVVIEGDSFSKGAQKVVKEELVIKTRRTRRNKLTVKIVDSANNEVEVKIKEKITGDEFVYSLNNNQDLRPGRYRILIEDSRGNAQVEEFWWGVLAVNTNKSAYALGEKVKVEMAVLDEYGAMVCDAKTKLIITEPDGQVRELNSESGQIWVNPECQIKGITSKPDYESGFDLGDKEGKYKVEFVAETRNGKYQTENYFEAVERPSYEIERQINTRLFPFEINRAKIKIRANEDFKGQLIEKVPVEFDLYLVENYTEFEEINTIEGKKEIAWELDLKENEEKELFYDYDAPDESPSYFELGEIRMVAEDGEKKFEEIRLWQMAVDAEATVGTGLRDATGEYSPSPSTVFVDANVGYTFVVGAGASGHIQYIKTSDAGTSWGSPVDINPLTPNVVWNNLAVWYDRWTPGDTTGNLIHLVAINVTNDDVYYNTFNTSDDSFGSWTVAFLGTRYDILTDGATSITKNSDGDILVSAFGRFVTDSAKVYKMSVGTTNFYNTLYTLSAGTSDVDTGQLLPLLGGDAIFILQDMTGNSLVSRVISAGTTEWGAEEVINSDWVENATYDQSWGAAVNKETGDVYLVGNDEIAAVNGAILTYKFSNTTRSWTQKENVTSNSPYLLQATIAIDQSNGDLFAIYISGIVNSDTNIYYKKSINGGDSWTPQSVKVNTVVDDYKYIRANMNDSNIIYAVWYNDDTNAVAGSEINKIVDRDPMPSANVVDLAIADATDEYSNSPNVVFTDVNNGYVFYVDAGNILVYSKTTNGGETWVLPVSIGITPPVWQNVSVWYDQWTPGDNSGNKIHIGAVTDTLGTSTDESFYYTYLSVGETDTLRSGGMVVAVGVTWTVDNYPGPSITKATDGDLFMMVGGGIGGVQRTDVYVSTDGGDTWTSTGYNTNLANADMGQVLPLSGGDILYLKQDVSLNQLYSNVYDGTWQTPVDVDVGSTIAENTSGTYDAQWGGSLNKSTGDIYLAVSTSVSLSGNDLMVYKMDVGRSWSTLTNVITNDNKLLQSAMAVNPVTGSLYVTYAIGGTINASTNVFYVQSIDDGATWSGATQINALMDDIKYVRTNLMSSERIVSLWYNDDLEDMVINSMGVTKMKQSAFRWYENVDSLDTGTTLAGNNVPITLGVGVTNVRLKLLLHAGVSVEALSNRDYNLQYAAKSGTCDTTFSGESFTDVGATSTVRYFDNASLDNGITLPPLRNDPTNGGATVIRQKYVETNTFTNDHEPIYAEKDGLWDFSLGVVGASPSTGYCLRVIRSDGSTLPGGYGYIAEFTTAGGGAPGPSMGDILRHGNWFLNGVKQIFTF